MEPLPWERLLWSGRASPLSAPRSIGVRYLLTDFRLVRTHRERVEELAIQDIGEVHRTESALDRLVGTSTLEVRPRDGRPPLLLHGVRDGAQLAAVVELLAGDPRARLDSDAVAAALAWRPQNGARRYGFSKVC